MSDQAQTKNLDTAAVMRSFYTIEIRGGSEQLAKLANTIIDASMDTAMDIVRNQTVHRRNAPQLILHKTLNVPVDEEMKLC